MGYRFKVIKNWDSGVLASNITKYLAIGWKLHGHTSTYMEVRSHAVTGAEYRAPMFFQSLTKEDADNVAPNAPKGQED